jgi:ABC-type branched-subunit amino acid transport system ATPase component
MTLQIKNVKKRFGGLIALDSCSFTCELASITGLVGPNGSGKSTLFNVITGITRPDAGEIRLAGKALTGLSPHRIARAGIGRTFQTTRLFPTLSVLENVLLGAPTTASDSAVIAEASTLLDRYAIASLAQRCADALSFGQKRLVELARAMIARPHYMLLDEPFAGLSPAMATDLARHVSELPQANVGVILIEHDLSMITRLCPRVLVLNRGRLIADGSPDEIRRHEDVIASYVGPSP